MLILGRAFSDKFSVIYQDASMTGIRFIFKDISEIQNPHLRELVKDGGFRRSIKNSDPPTTIVYLSQHLRDEARARTPSRNTTIPEPEFTSEPESEPTPDLEPEPEPEPQPEHEEEPDNSSGIPGFDTEARAIKFVGTLLVFLGLL